MRMVRLAALIALSALACSVPLTGTAQDNKEAPPPRAGTQPVPPAPVYKPPPRGAPGGRVGGSTRGTGREIFVLSVLAPDHTGLTIQEQPSLYWFISSTTSAPVELTITDPGTTRPLLEISTPAPITPGLHRLRLADHGVRLAAGTTYRWFAAVVPDPARRSRDILAGGAIERVDVSPELAAKLAKAGASERPALYAEAGIWYDALAALSEMIDSEPGNSALRKQRAALLAQVGLPELPD
ncbi:MAG: DUF928 domain-containing protein [Candidatus Rokuibacteriota bacterium]